MATVGSAPRLSSWRYVVVAMTAAAALWMYIDRVCFSTLSVDMEISLGVRRDPRLLGASTVGLMGSPAGSGPLLAASALFGGRSRDTLTAFLESWGLDPMAIVLGAFFFAYALFQVPAGAFGDRFGPRMALAVCIAGWSLATAATAFAGDLFALFAARLVLGMAEAGAYPAAASLLARWAAPGERGTFSGIVSVGGRLGGAIAPYLTGFLAVALLAWGPLPGFAPSINGDWRGVFFLFGTSGLLVAAAFWLVVRDHPPWHVPPLKETVDKTAGAVAAAAEEKTLADPTVAPSRSPRPSALRLILSSPNMWFTGAAQFGVNLGWAFLITLLPRYLDKKYGIGLAERGLMQSVPLLVGCIGMLGGGFLTDFLRKPLGPRWCRSIPLGAALLVGAAIFAIMPFLATAWQTIWALACIALVVDLGVPAFWAFNQDVGGKNVGKVFGWGNMWGNFGAAVSPVVLARVTQAFGWDASFATCAGAFTVAGIAALLMNATLLLDPPATELPPPPP